MDEERLRRVHQLGEVFSPWFHQFEDARDPRRFASRQAVAPESARLQAPLNSPKQLRARQTCDVLLVEPVQFFRVEDGIPAADALEGKERHELVLIKDLAVVAR